MSKRAKHCGVQTDALVPTRLGSRLVQSTIRESPSSRAQTHLQKTLLLKERLERRQTKKFAQHLQISDFMSFGRKLQAKNARAEGLTNQLYAHHNAQRLSGMMQTRDQHSRERVFFRKLVSRRIPSKFPKNASYSVRYDWPPFNGVTCVYTAKGDAPQIPQRARKALRKQKCV